MSRVIICNRIYIKEKNVNYVYIRNARNIKITYLFLKKLLQYLSSAFSIGNEKKILILFFCFLEKILIAGNLPVSKKAGTRKRNQRLREKLLNFNSFFEEENRFVLEIDPGDQTFIQKLFI